MPTKISRRRWPMADINQVKTLAAKGKTCSEIAVALQRTYDSIRKIAKRHQIQIENKGELVASPRQEAKALGLLYYSTGKVCKNGHLSERFVSNGGCRRCVLILGRPFRRKHGLSDKYKKAKKKYENTKKGRSSAAARRRRYLDTPHGQIRRKLSGATKRAKKRPTYQTQSTTADLRKIFDRGKRCHICGKPFTRKNPPTLDHVLALAKGGTNEPSNFAPAHLRCNIRKQAQRTHLI